MSIADFFYHRVLLKHWEGGGEEEGRRGRGRRVWFARVCARVYGRIWCVWERIETVPSAALQFHTQKQIPVLRVENIEYGIQ